MTPFKQHGFTLIELLIYMGILAVTVGIVFLIIKNEHSVSLTYELSSISAGSGHTCAVKNGLVIAGEKITMVN